MTADTSFEAPKETTTPAESGWSRDDLLVMLAHDIRNATQGITSWAHLICQQFVSDEVKLQGLEAIRRSGMLQARLIRQLIGLSRSERGDLVGELCRVDVRSILDGVIKSMSPQALAKGINIQTEFGPAMALVTGDPTQLEEVFINLLANAIKFTPAGGRIRAEIKCIDGNARINVIDTGRGIGSDFLPHVFERYRKEKEDPQGNEGLGLGLAIARYLIEKHGGNIYASSAGEGKGATFTVSLPLAARALSGAPR